MAGAVSGWFASLFRPAKALANQRNAPPVIGIDDPRYDSFFAARAAVWSTCGKVDDDVIAYLISPEFNGAPAWPTTRQAFRVVRPEGSLIIASDGLSDLFVDTNLTQAGFECEVYIESPDLAGSGFADIRSSWQFDLIESLARNVADFGGIQGPISKYGIFSMELPAPATMPAHWLTQRGTVGALVNMTVPDRPARCQLDEGVEIRIVALTILLPDETEYVVAGGAETRAEIAQRLISSGTGLTSPVDRPSVLA
ncbi:MAG: hypothetical protein NWP98_10775 [Erythrobacter sp.]|nr:hypothetical protein [Erythrobacter sp.]